MEKKKTHVNRCNSSKTHHEIMHCVERLLSISAHNIKLHKKTECSML